MVIAMVIAMVIGMVSVFVCFFSDVWSFCPLEHRFFFVFPCIISFGDNVNHLELNISKHTWSDYYGHHVSWKLVLNEELIDKKFKSNVISRNDKSCFTRSIGFHSYRGSYYFTMTCNYFQRFLHCIYSFGDL